MNSIPGAAGAELLRQYKDQTKNYLERLCQRPAFLSAKDAAVDVAAVLGWLLMKSIGPKGDKLSSILPWLSLLVAASIIVLPVLKDSKGVKNAPYS